MKKFLSATMIIAIVAAMSTQLVFASADVENATDSENETEIVEEIVKNEGTEDEKVKVPVNENKDFGVNYDKPVDIVKGEIVQLPDGKNLVREGYIFLGWNTDPNATEGFFEYLMPDADVTLYAIWAVDPNYVPIDAAQPVGPANKAPEPDVVVPEVGGGSGSGSHSVKPDEKLPEVSPNPETETPVAPEGNAPEGNAENPQTNTPSEDTTVPSTPNEETPVTPEDKPAENNGDVPTTDETVPDKPAEEVPAEPTPAAPATPDEPAVEDAPVEDAPVEDAPAAEEPTEAAPEATEPVPEA